MPIIRKNPFIKLAGLIALQLYCMSFAFAGTDVFNVRDYGALGNGIDNDSDAFNWAILAASVEGGGTVYVPCGTYLLGKNLGSGAGFYSGARIPSDNISIIGEGRCSELRPVSSDGNAIISICKTAPATLETLESSCNDPQPIKNIVIKDLAFFDPNPFEHRGSEESHGIVAKYVENLSITDNFFWRIGDEAVDVQGGENIKVSDNTFDGCPSIGFSRGSAISVSSLKHASITNNSIMNAPFSTLNRGIDIATNTAEEISWVNVSNNRFISNNFDRAIYISSNQAPASNISILSNQIETDKRNAIDFSGSSFERSNIILSKNVISGTIRMRANNLLISENVLSGSVGNALEVDGLGVKIINNTIRNFPDSCIHVINSENAGPFEFSGNSCLDVSSSGSNIINFFAPEKLLGPLVVKNNFLIAAPGASNGISARIDAVISGNTISGVNRAITSGGLISNNTIRDVGQYGINILSDNTHVTNNRIKNAGSRCIFLYEVNNTIVSGNMMENCGKFALSVGGGTSNTICIGNNASNNDESVDINCDEMASNIQPGDDD